jgi:hypothetical protein
MNGSLSSFWKDDATSIGGDFQRESGELLRNLPAAITGLDGLGSAFERLTQRAIEAADGVGRFGQAASGLGGLGTGGAGPAAEVAATARQFEALGAGLTGFEEHGETAALTLDRLAKSVEGSGRQARAMGEDVDGARAGLDKFARAGTRTGDDVTRVFRRAGQEIERGFTQSFEDMITSGRFSFDKLAGSVRSIFKKLAGELAAMLVIRPILGGIGLGSFLPGVASAGTGDGAPRSLLSNGSSGINTLSNLSNLSWTNNPLASLGRGAVNFFGLGSTTNLGLAAAPELGFLGGGALETGAGSLLGGSELGLAALDPTGVGLAIAAIGAIAGFSLFGKKKPSVGPNANAQVLLHSGQFTRGGSGADNGGDRAGAENFADATIRTLQAQSRGLGVTWSGDQTGPFFGAVGNFPSKGGYFSRVGDDSRTFGEDQGAATADFIRRSLLRGVEDGAAQFSGDPAVAANITAALRNTTAKATEELSNDLTFARGFKDQIDLMNGALDPAASQLIRLRQAAEQSAAAVASAAQSFIDKAKELFKSGQTTTTTTRSVAGATYTSGQAAIDAGAITQTTERIAEGEGQYTERTTYQVQGLAEAFATLDDALAALHGTTVSITETATSATGGTQIVDAQTAVRADLLAKMGLRRTASGGFAYVPEDQRTRPLTGLDLALEMARKNLDAWLPVLKQFGFTAEEARAAVDAARAATEAKARADWQSAEFVRRRNVEVGLKSKLDPDFQIHGGDLLAAIGLDPRNFAGLRDQINATVAGFKGGKDDIAAIQALYDGLIGNQVRDGKLTAEQAAQIANSLAEQSSSLAEQSKTKLQAWTAALQAATREIDSQAQALTQQKSTWEKLGQSMKTTRESLLIDKGLSPLSAGDRYAEISRRYADAAARAGKGDTAAIEELPDLTRTLLEASKENFGATEEYYADFQRTQAALQASETLAERQVAIAEQQLAKLDEVKRALERQAGGNPDRNWGGNPVRNHLIAQLTGYTGDFGSGGYGRFAAALPANLRQAADQIAATINFAEGGIMTPLGAVPLNRYGFGGVALGPQLALFGEGRMAEAYVPLPDGRSIPVTLRSANTGRGGVGWGGANDNAGLVAELRALRVEVAQLRAERSQDHRAAQDMRLGLRRDTRDLALPIKAGARA